MRLTALLRALLSLAGAVECACECGYVLHDTMQYYTHHLTTDFSHYPDVTALNKNPAASGFSADWTVQSWSAGGSSNDSIPRRNDESNVFVQNGTLVLRQLGYSDQDRTSNKSVSVAAIVSNEQGFLHGSFRSIFKVSEDRGSVGGFFWYHVRFSTIGSHVTMKLKFPSQNDTNEIDLEVLTKEPNDTTVHYTTHPSVLPSGSVVPGASTAARLNLPWTDFQEHRFDWTRDNVTFYQDGVASHTTIANVPQVGGSVQLNLWADGSAWSGEPSKTDVIMAVKSIQMYFNTTTSDSGLDTAFNDVCTRAGGRNTPDAVCFDRVPGASGAASCKLVRWYGTVITMSTLGAIIF